MENSYQYPPPGEPPPIRVIRARRLPPVTAALIGLNVAVFAAMVLNGVPLLDPTAAQLRDWGADWGPLSLGGQPWRMLTANYIHIGLIHLLVNMWSLWVIGYLAEDIFGAWTYALVYTVCGLAGSVASLWWNPGVVGAGASGAIFGLVGAAIAGLYLGRLPYHPQARQRMLMSLLQVAALNLIIGSLAQGIDNSAHIGGLLAGLALGAVLARQLTAPPAVQLAWRVVVFPAAAAALLAGFLFVRHVNGQVLLQQQGQIALDAGQYDEAARALEAARAIKPDDVNTAELLADTYLQQKDYAKAEPALQSLLQLDPKNEAAQYNLGFVQIQLEEYDAAVASLKKAVQLAPQDAGAEEALGEACQADHLPTEAQAAFAKAASLRQAGKSP